VERNPTQGEIDALKAVARATATAFENVRLINHLQEAVERREFLIRELDHRVKNTLAAVQAIARQSLKAGHDPARFEAAFSARLKAMSQTHELLALGSWAPASLDDLARRVLAPMMGDGTRLSISGPPVTFSAEAAVAVGIGLHELATNAVKYGALSQPGGAVALAWSTPLEGETRGFELEWRECGGPAPAAERREGMGSALLNRGLPRTLGGEGMLAFFPEGVCYRLVAPMSGRIALA
jgi:two-component sensor histidine kinase